MSRRLPAPFAVLSLALLAACGGGGDGSGGGDSGSAGAAAGLWNGSTTTGRAVTGIVLGDGTYYVFYSEAGFPNTIAGAVQGSGSGGSSSFTSTNARDFNLEGLGVSSAGVTATATAKQSFNGNILYTGGTVTTFSSTYNVAYETKPTLAALAGTYTGSVALSAGTLAAVVTVAANGTLSSTASGCTIGGSATPRSDGNAYDVTISFGPAPCFFANQSFNGLAYLDAASKRLYAAAPNGTRSDGVLFVGTKP